MKKKWILFAIIAVSTCLSGIRAEAASKVNDSILNNNIKPIGETLSLGKIYLQNPSKNGGINMDFNDGKPKMVIIHETANDSSTLNDEISYMINNQWIDAPPFVHSFVSDSQLVTIADKSKKVWGSGPYGNSYGIQIEQTRVKSRDAFAKQIANLANWTAVQMIQYNLGIPTLMSSPSSPQKNNLSIKPDGNLASHKMIAYKFNQTTTHVDPDAYWKDRGLKFFGQGYDMWQFRDLVEYYYRLQGVPEIISTSVEGNPASGEFKVRVKTSGVVTRVSVPTWSNANGQDDLVWYPATKVKDGEYLATFDGANHNYQSGPYSIHAYAYNGSRPTSRSVSANLQVNYPTTPSVHYQTYLQSIGWQQSVTDGAMSGTVGQALRVEAMKLAVTGNISGNIQYRTHVQSIGWQDNVSNNALSGTTGKALRVEAVQMDLTGDLKSQYDIYYRVQIQSKGWLGWAKNGQSAGSQGFRLRLEAMEIRLVKKGTAFDVGSAAFVVPNLELSYQTHIQSLGWQENVRDGEVSGTTGKSLRLEGIKINLANVELHNLTGGIQYQTHVQQIGWQDVVSDNALSGTTGQSLRVEGIRINLTGTLAQNYDIYYRAYIQSKGWLGWAKNGASAGSQGLALRLEAIQIKLVSKGGAFDAGGTAFVVPTSTPTPMPVPTPIPTPTPSPIPTPVFNLTGVNDTKKAWLNAIYPEAQKLAKANDLFPSIMMSQTIAESDWGQSELATKANNLFGIKADASWKGAKYTALTKEEAKNDGKVVDYTGKEISVKKDQVYQIYADFRKYTSQAESLRDYVTKIKTTPNDGQPTYRYLGAWRSQAKTYQNAANALQAGGYATGRNYATNLINRIVNYRLDTLD